MASRYAKIYQNSKTCKSTLGPLDWDLGSTSENKYKIASRSIGLLPFSEALPKIPSKTWKKQKYRQGAAQ